MLDVVLTCIAVRMLDVVLTCIAVRMRLMPIHLGTGGKTFSFCLYACTIECQAVIAVQ